MFIQKYKIILHLYTMRYKRLIYIAIITGIMVAIGVWAFKNFNFNSDFEVGQEVDGFNGVSVYYNGGVSHISGRNLTDDGYNLGMKYQCVESVKRYYYQYLNHKMPDSYGNAKDFFNTQVADGKMNESRNLNQYTNPSKSKPKTNDLIIFNGTIFNRFGHVAIITNVSENEIEIIQQNPGPFEKSRKNFSIENRDGKWSIKNEKVAGWLRKN